MQQISRSLDSAVYLTFRRPLNGHQSSLCLIRSTIRITIRSERRSEGTLKGAMDQVSAFRIFHGVEKKFP